MNLHKTYFAAALLGGLLLTSGCENDLLDQDNPNAAPVETFWKTEADALKGLTAAYSGLQLNGTYRRWIHFAYDIRSDEGHSTSPWPDLQNFNKFQIINYDFVVNAEIWQQHYQGIFRTNQVLANVPNIQMPEPLKKRVIAEARFLRALHYFNLTSLYGRPALVLEAPESVNSRFPQAATEQAAWDFVIAELLQAKADLPDSYTGADVGRVTKGAATALLGKAYMQTKKWNEASAQFAEIISSNRYSLVPNFRDNFKHTTENNAESIFEVQFVSEFSADREDDFAGASEANQRSQFFGMPGKGWNDGEVRPWVLEEFLKERRVDGKKDPRLAATAFFARTRPLSNGAAYPVDPTDPVDQDQITYDNLTLEQRFPNDARNRNRIYWRKYANDYWRNEEGYYSPINHRVIRYADVLLLQAEALNERGQTAAAIPLVNQVRARAGLAPLAGLSQEGLRMQLMHERVTELAGENWRWHDLRRWGLLDDAARVNQLKARDEDFNFFVVGKTHLLPIPRTDVDVAKLAQNPGY
ncbi:RagB/SusD family nutrient uptake outer membrane protein [Hymenobacter weizhouensis]|uniref:RagB/SusD family nutrient uptake outer membrane protein n=1 Tax=Hymenobacter sp. YIM 151500-1 TaxID=2987689 RepID=UPI002226DA75|nr:RagB/SusD family nutrient uptake outer membrane protein [Hymenobacter sp. YIM 151500-1]UYZ62092.1 RagB/SusD family nutrient uptake outer membrane protein [Hymenobacter sp. YIM 151500-1]